LKQEQVMAGQVSFSSLSARQADEAMSRRRVMLRRHIDEARVRGDSAAVMRLTRALETLSATRASRNAEAHLRGA